MKNITDSGSTLWTIDPFHTTVAFSVRHLMITNVHGVFDRVSGSVRYDAAAPEQTVGDLSLCLYASPGYLSKQGVPASVQDLDQHRCIVSRWGSPLPAAELGRTWNLRGPKGEASVTVRGQICGDDMSFVRGITSAGGGIGLLPQLNCAADEASGRLVRVLPGFHARGATLYVIYPSTKQVPLRVAVFRDFVTQAFAAWSARQQSA